MSKIERIFRPGNVELLRKMLLDRDAIRKALFDKILASDEDENEIERIVQDTLAEISRKRSGDDAHLVADSLSAWGLRYSNVARAVMIAVLGTSNLDSSVIGEGVLIGLLELFAEETNDELLFRNFTSGPLASCLANSYVTTTGMGRSSGAISRFLEKGIVPGDFPSDRLARIMVFLYECRISLPNTSPYQFSGDGPCNGDSVYTYFIHELAGKLLLSGNLALRLELFSCFVMNSTFKQHFLVLLKKHAPGLTLKSAEPCK